MVVASLFKAGKPHFHTNGGELANGYHLFVYDAQTNNPANLYMDAKGKFPYPNPIVLNSRGEPNGDGLYGIVGRKYKLIYKDFTNKTIYTIDEIIVSNVESIGIEDTPDDDILYGRQNGEWKEIPLSELSETVILEYGDDSTFDDVLAMLNAGKRVLVNVDPFYSNNNAIGSDGVQKYPISPYKVLLQGNIPTGNPYIDFTGYVGGSVVQVSHVQLWNSSAPSMPSKINNWCVNDTNPTELAKKSELTTLTSRVNVLEKNSGQIATEYGGSIIGAGLLAYLPADEEERDAGNFVVRVVGTIDEETGAHAGCFSLGEMLIPSGKNPQILGTLGDAPVPVFGLGRGGPGWYLLEANGGGGIRVPETAEVVITPNVKADGGLSLTSEGSAHITEKTGLSFELPFVQLKQEPWNNTEEKVGLSFEMSYLNLYRDYAPITTETGDILTTETNESIDVLLK